MMSRASSMRHATRICSNRSRARQVNASSQPRIRATSCSGEIGRITTWKKGGFPREIEDMIPSWIVSGVLLPRLAAVARRMSDQPVHQAGQHPSEATYDDASIGVLKG